MIFWIYCCLNMTRLCCPTSVHNPHCKFTIFHSKSFFKKSKLDIYKCPILNILKYF